MIVDGREWNQMLHDVIEPGLDVVEALGVICDLLRENGLEKDPKYLKAKNDILESVYKFQEMAFDSGMEICRQNFILKTLKQDKHGNRLLQKVSKEIES